MNPLVVDARGSAPAKAAVRGWLLLICLMLSVVGPLISVWLMVHEYRQLAPHFAASAALRIGTQLSLALTAAAVGFGCYAGLRLWALKPGAPATAKAALLFGLVVEIVSSGLQLALGPTPAVYGEWFHDVALGVLPGLIFFVACFGYLNKSARVEALYR